MCEDLDCGQLPTRQCSTDDITSLMCGEWHCHEQRDFFSESRLPPSEIADVADVLPLQPKPSRNVCVPRGTQITGGGYFYGEVQPFLL